MNIYNEKKYNYITRGGELEKVIKSIERAIKYNIKIKINSV